jgi:hypothetical protein
LIIFLEYVETGLVVVKFINCLVDYAIIKLII